VRSEGSLFEAIPGKKFLRPYLNQELSMVVCACHPSYGGMHKVGGWRSRPTWAKKTKPISKITGAKVQEVGLKQ
jgi:hypothetical protein